MRRLAYLAVCGVVLSGPAWAGENPEDSFIRSALEIHARDGGTDCLRPAGELNILERKQCIEVARDARNAWRGIVGSFMRAKRDDGSVHVLRGRPSE